MHLSVLTAKGAFLVVLIAGGAVLSGCGKQTNVAQMGPSEQLAIKFVKAHQSDNQFSVASNIEQQAGQERRNGNLWQNKTWQAGLASEKEQYLAALSQYFNIVKAPTQRVVRFTYTDKDGQHEARWNIDLYTKQTVPQNALAKRFTFPEEIKLLASQTKK